MSDLNPRQEKFISEYLKTLNVTQSAIKAGYSPHLQVYKVVDC